MEIALLIHFSTSYARILLVGDNDASWSVDGLPRTVDIVLATDWIFQTVRPSLDDTPSTCSELSP